MWELIVSVLDHCLSFYYGSIQCSRHNFGILSHFHYYQPNAYPHYVFSRSNGMYKIAAIYSVNGSQKSR